MALTQASLPLPAKPSAYGSSHVLCLSHRDLQTFRRLESKVFLSILEAFPSAKHSLALFEGKLRLLSMPTAHCPSCWGILRGP